MNRKVIIIITALILFVTVFVIAGRYIYNKIKVRKASIIGYIQTKEIDEISGIAASGIFPGVYYVHNDQGDTSRFFAVSQDGKLRATIYYRHDLKIQDWKLDCEDIAVGPGPLAGKSYVYLGDIGDNSHERSYVTVYRFEEQTSWLNDTASTIVPEQLHIVYPDGPGDAETIMVDPVDKLLYIVKKRKDPVHIYSTPLNFTANETRVLTRHADLHFHGLKPFKYITSGAISKDGSKILLKSYENVYYWQRKKGESVWQAMQREPKILYYEIQKQGEAIGFTQDGKGYYTISEGAFASIYYYHLP